ncbi:MAG: LacI family transcriptional regulator [Lachnospiraceae bacterium]|jgi:LacI family transcriptional regulator|nr:LacI family transcriptional regulator [Lachnospiraceae bacterium]
MKKRKLSINEFARSMGTSPATISRALNDRPGVGEELRQKIKEEAQRIGYISNSSLKKYTREKRKIIAVLANDIRNPYYADIICAIKRELDCEGYQMIVFNTDDKVDEVISVIDLIEELKCSGMIQITVASEQIGRVLKKCSIPTVLINRMLKSFDTDVVTLDNFEAGYIVTRHLIERGHSHIGYLRGPLHSSSSYLRYEGYLKAMKNYRLAVPKYAVYEGDLMMETGHKCAEEFARIEEKRPTAMVISNDLAAHGFVLGCIQEGIRIPEDVSVISFDNNRFAATSVVPITTVDCFANEMGSKAARVMIKRLNDPQKKIERVIMRPVLIERSSIMDLSSLEI